MSNSVKVHILRVFVNEEKKFGNPVGIIVDEKQEIDPKVRQKVATSLGFSESVFINDLNTGNVNIFNPKKEVNFAGHALVGTAYLINKLLGKPVDSLECKGGHIKTWKEGNNTWISANLENTPLWYHKELRSAAKVENFDGSNKEHVMIWSWTDKDKGIVCARTFAPDWGIPEDKANGSGSMQLASILKQKLEIHHGKGSVIYAKPAGTGSADVGGRVEEDPTQEVGV